MNFLAQLAALVSVIVVALPFELVALEAAKLPLQRKWRVLAYLLIPKTFFWSAPHLPDALGPKFVIPVMIVLQLACSWYALSSDEVRGWRLYLAMFLLTLIFPAFFMALGVLLMPLLMSHGS